MKAALTYDEALHGHELDVAALEIESPGKQLENLEKWLGWVGPQDAAKVAKALSVARTALRSGAIRRVRP